MLFPLLRRCLVSQNSQRITITVLHNNHGALLPLSRFPLLTTVVCFASDVGAKELHKSAPNRVDLIVGKKKIA